MAKVSDYTVGTIMMEGLFVAQEDVLYGPYYRVNRASSSPQSHIMHTVLLKK